MDSQRAADLDARAREFRSSIDAARALTALRTGVLGGRGPGADDAEVEDHTSRRRSLGGRPVIEYLDETARRTESFRSTGGGPSASV